MTRQPWRDCWMMEHSVMNSTLNTTDNGSRCGVAFKRQLSVCRVLLVGLAGTTDLWRGKTLRVRIRRRSTCLRREPTATRGRSSSMACAWRCKTR